MQTIANKTELLQKLAAQICTPQETAHVKTGLPALDELAPGGGFRRGAVHELLWPTSQKMMPMSLALLLAKAALREDTLSGTGARTVIAWSDPLRELYPPAVAAAGVDLSRLMLLRPGTPAEELQIIAECLRCPAVLATVGVVNRLTQLQARRLQLAAEAGGQLGILMRPAPASAASPAAHSATGPPDCYAAASRWLVRPEPGSDLFQRWRIQLVHGHGGRVGSSVLLEKSRATGTTTALRLPETLADRPPAAAGARPSA